MKYLPFIIFSIITISTLHAADIHREIKRAIETKDRERVHQLINADNINNDSDPFGCRLLSYAIQYDNDIALDLIKLGADVNIKCNSGATPLHYATVFNRPLVVQELLKYGASPIEKDLEENTPSDVAKILRNLEIIQIFTDHDNDSLDIKEPEQE
jgi:ankyrin repeat protein